MPSQLSALLAGFRRQGLLGISRLGILALALSALSVASLPAAEEEVSTQDRSESYYHFALGHLYHQFAQQFRRAEYVERADREYLAALERDPGSVLIRIELINLYASANRLSDAVKVAESVLDENPDNAEIHRLMGRIYQGYSTRNRERLDAELLAKAIEHFERVVEIEPDNAENHTDLGVLYRTASRLDDARESLQRAIELDPGQAGAQVDLAYLLLEGEKFDEAIGVLEGLVASENSDLRSIGALADAYEQVGRFRDAAEMYQRIVDGGGNTMQARRRLAETLFFSRQFGKARDQYQILATLDADNAIYHLRISQVERERGNFPKAWESLDRARRLDPDSLQIKLIAVDLLQGEGRLEEAAEQTRNLLDATRKTEYSRDERDRRMMLLGRLGQLQRELKRSEAAVDSFWEIAELNPNLRLQAYAEVVETWRVAREYSRAESEARKGFAEFDNDPGIANLLATVLSDRGKTKEAIKVAQRMRKAGASEFEVTLSMAQIYQKGRQFAKAEDQVDRAMKLAKSEQQRVTVLFSAGALYERAKKYEESESSFRELLAIEPDNADALNYLGYTFADRGVNLDEAHDLIQRALDLEPNNGAFLDSLGWVYFQQDKIDLAVKYLERSLKQHGDDPVIHSHLGDAYFKLGRVAEAKHHWNRGLEEWNRSSPAERDTSEVESLRQKLSELEVSLADAPGAEKKPDVER